MIVLVFDGLWSGLEFQVDLAQIHQTDLCIRICYIKLIVASYVTLISLEPYIVTGSAFSPESLPCPHCQCTRELARPRGLQSKTPTQALPHGPPLNQQLS